MRPLHPALRKEVCSKPVMGKEKRREVPVHVAPVQEAPIHEAPSVDRVQVPSGDPQGGVDDRHVPPGEVVHEEPNRRPEVIEASSRRSIRRAGTPSRR